MAIRDQGGDRCFENRAFVGRVRFPAWSAMAVQCSSDCRRSHCSRRYILYGISNLLSRIGRCLRSGESLRKLQEPVAPILPRLQDVEFGLSDYARNLIVREDRWLQAHAGDMLLLTVDRLDFSNKLAVKKKMRKRHFSTGLATPTSNP